MTDPITLSDDFNQMVELTCKARIGPQEVVVRQVCLAGVYRDADARKAIEAQLRYQLMVSILEKWKPKITVRR